MTDGPELDLPSSWSLRLCSVLMLWCFCLFSTPPARLEGRVPVKKVRPIDLLTCDPSIPGPWPSTRTRPCCSPVTLTIPPAANTPVTPSSTSGLEGRPSQTENWATARDRLLLFLSSPLWTKSDSKTLPGLTVITLSVTHLQSCRRDSTVSTAVRVRLCSPQRAKQHKQQHLGLRLEQLNPQRQISHPRPTPTPP